MADASAISNRADAHSSPGTVAVEAGRVVVVRAVEDMESAGDAGVVGGVGEAVTLV